MYSGKTDELVRRAVRATYATQGVLVCTKDTRYGRGRMVTHSGRELESCYMDMAENVYELDLSGISVVCFDEAQFFGPNLKDVCLKLAATKRIIVAGLDMDYLGIPFENMASLMGVAEYVSKLTAICVTCGAPATRSHRKSLSTDRVLEGDMESYEALCRPCYMETLDGTRKVQQPDGIIGG